MVEPLPKQVVASGAFDDLRSRQIRFLEEAAKLGSLTVLLWNDESLRRLTGAPPKFPGVEREYMLNAIRFVDRVEVIDGSPDLDSVPEVAGLRPDYWVLELAQDSARNKAFWAKRGVQYCVFQENDLLGFPENPATFPRGPAATRTREACATDVAQACLPAGSGSLLLPDAGPVSGSARKKIVVTGCFDWLHSGHVRFFEEVSGYGDLYVVVGNDANVRLLKGAPHPMHSQDERRYAVGSIRFVTQALISSGQGWLDAEPEIARLRPDIYAVNEDGDQGGKRQFCAGRGIEYLVLRRTPAPGLPPRSSTELRGF